MQKPSGSSGHDGLVAGMMSPARFDGTISRPGRAIGEVHPVGRAEHRDAGPPNTEHRTRGQVIRVFVT
jgi:hypothetical protein